MGVVVPVDGVLPAAALAVVGRVVHLEVDSGLEQGDGRDKMRGLLVTIDGKWAKQRR